MFRIGEFSRIARVSGRLLRYYDGIGLLNPVRIDPSTGYRYYSANQLGDLNRILALKGLGFSLDEVARMLGDKIPASEIRGMLVLRKAELERTLSEEESRLRQVESRLRQIEEEGALADYDVVVKSTGPLPFLSVRRTFCGMGEAVAMLRSVAQTVTARVPRAIRGGLVVVAYSDFEEEELDLDIGCSLAREYARPVALKDATRLALSELPGVETMATLVRRGPKDQSHLAFGALGRWMEANGYDIAGPGREVFLEPPFQRPDDDDPVMEIQFPVVKAT